MTQESYEAAIEALIKAMKDRGFTALQIAEKFIKGDISIENSNDTKPVRTQFDIFGS